MLKKIEDGLAYWVVQENDSVSDVLSKINSFGEKDVLVARGRPDVMEAVDDTLELCESLIEDYRICIDSHLYSKDPQVICRAFAEHYTPEKTVSDLKFTCYKYSEIKEWARKQIDYNKEGWASPEVRDMFGHYNFYGFHYFSLQDCFGNADDKVKFLMAFSGDKPVGVIKFGVWPLTPDHQGLAYIDVNRFVQRQGVATKMIQELNSHLDHYLPFYLTAESDTGREANIAQLFKKEITATKCFTYDEQLDMCK